MKPIRIVSTMTLLFLVLFGFTTYLSAQEAEAEQRIAQLEQRVEELEQEVDENTRDIGIDQNGLLALQKEQWGTGWGLELSGGAFGQNGEANLGIFAPRLFNVLLLGIRGVFFGSIEHYLFTDDGTLEDRFMTYSVLGGPYLLWGSPMYFNFTRIYGGMQILAGQTFFAEADRDEPVPALSITGFGGFEIYSSRYACIFVEVGGGPLLVLGDDHDRYEEAAITGGYSLRLGSRFYPGAGK